MELQTAIDEIRASAFKRIYIEACLLATNDLKAISETLEVPEEVLVEYERLHFPYGRESRFTKLEYVDSIQDEGEKSIKLWAITQGFNFIKWRLGFKVDLSPVDGMKELYADCIFKAKEAFFNSNSTDSSKEALRWVNQSTFIAKMIKAWVADSKEAIKDIELALQEMNGENVSFGQVSEFDDPAVLNGASEEEHRYSDAMEAIMDQGEAALKQPEPTFQDMRRFDDVNMMP